GNGDTSHLCNTAATGVIAPIAPIAAPADAAAPVGATLVAIAPRYATRRGLEAPERAQGEANAPRRHIDLKLRVIDHAWSNMLIDRLDNEIIGDRVGLQRIGNLESRCAR